MPCDGMCVACDGVRVAFERMCGACDGLRVMCDSFV